MKNSARKRQCYKMPFCLIKFHLIFASTVGYTARCWRHYFILGWEMSLGADRYIKKKTKQKGNTVTYIWWFGSFIWSNSGEGSSFHVVWLFRDSCEKSICWSGVTKQEISQFLRVLLNYSCFPHACLWIILCCYNLFYLNNRDWRWNLNLGNTEL